MELANCRRCGQLFVRQRNIDVCQNCAERDEQQLHQIKELLYRRPGLPLHAVVQETGIDLARIRRWIEEGRLGQR